MGRRPRLNHNPTFKAKAAVYSIKGEKKLIGLAQVWGALYALNILRLCGLYFISAYRPAWFTPVHVYLAPTLFILAALLLFAGWAVAVGSDVRR